MPEYLRALIYVLVMAAPAFYLGQQVARLSVPDREFKLWRNAWIPTSSSSLKMKTLLVRLPTAEEGGVA